MSSQLSYLIEVWDVHTRWANDSVLGFTAKLLFSLSSVVTDSRSLDTLLLFFRYFGTLPPWGLFHGAFLDSGSLGLLERGMERSLGMLMV